MNALSRFALDPAFALAWVLVLCSPAPAQQAANQGYHPVVDDPMHARDSGPVVLIDEGHHNFHTKDGRYAPFASLVAADGYRLGAHAGRFTATSLDGADVVVISNSLNAANVEEWELPTPSAFTDAEIEALVHYVQSGGSLFLIADHMPFPGAAAALAARFNIEFSNGYVFELDAQDQRVEQTVFRRADGRIGNHVITTGRNAAETINQVATFTGSAFPITGNAVSLIHFGQYTEMLLPTVAWEFDEATSRARIPGWSQGVAIEHGDGRVVIFGEAAMFSSQNSGDGASWGLTSPEAPDNEQLLLNIVRWLASDLQAQEVLR